MSQPFLGEIKIISWNFAPKGWAFCNGQLLPINQNQALFSILGTTFGGDGRVNFGLPDFRGRIPTYVGDGLVLGQKGGEEFHTVTTTEMPTHNHFLLRQNAEPAASSASFRSTDSVGAQLRAELRVSPNAGQLTTINPIDRDKRRRQHSRTRIASRSWCSISSLPFRAFSRRETKGGKNMGEPFVGEIRMFGGTFAPAGWAMCQGQSMAISENDTLFNLIGTTYGGDGQETFNLPDLAGTLPGARGPGTGDLAELPTGRESRRRVGHAHHQPDSDSQPYFCRFTRCR